jgi:uncharacterized membrane protein
MSQTITIPYFEVTLTYADSSAWFVGGFSSLDAANTWIAMEQTRPYWKSSNAVTILDKSSTSEVQGNL